MIGHAFSQQNSFPPQRMSAIGVDDACVKTSQRLNEIMQTHDIETRLAYMGDDKVADNIGPEWYASEFAWHKHVAPFNKLKQTFFIGLFKGYNLYGLCESGLTITARKKVSLDIKFIEGYPYPKKNPLRGYVIPCFAEATLQIAKASDISFIGVDRPKKETISQYKRLGYRQRFWENMKVMKPVKKETKLNWNKLVARRQRQGFSIPFNV